MAPSDRVREIMSWYDAENTGVRTNLYRMMNTGRLAGSGKLVILPVDQGCEHGPARTFACAPQGYDPHYHFQLAIESGCSAYAAPLGALEAGAHEFAGQIPTILKVNNNNSLFSQQNPDSAVTSTVEDALRLGCSGIGFTIYPGSAYSQGLYEELREITREAKSKGLVVVVWSYPRGEQISKAGETGIDVVSYAAHLAAQLGANIIKVKPPTAHLEQDAARKAYLESGRSIDTLADRVKDVVQSCFNGRRIVIFSGGASKSTEEVFEDVRQIAAGGGFGSIMGRNAFQRPKEEALALLKAVMDIYAAG